jgi:hypothetical protein
MITSRILGNSRGLVFGLMVGGRLRFNDDCMRLNWGSGLMMIRIRNKCRSRGLVLSLLFGRTLGFHYGSTSLNSSVYCSIAATNE